MKKGYKRLIIFEIILLIILMVNSFVWNILDKYNMIIFLIGNIVVFRFLFGLEKDRHRYTKDIIYEIIIILIISFLLYYVLGVFISFYKANNYYTLYGLKTFIAPVTLTIILKEFLRYQILKKSEGNRLLLITTCILFIFIDITNNLYYADLTTSYNLFMFIALIFLPAVSNNIICTYISAKSGYKPNILWLMVTKLYIYLLPIIPNPNEYILSIIRFIFPFIIGYKLYLFYEKTQDEEIERDYKKTKKWTLIFPTIIVIILVYFTSGYFHYYALAIASGSMSPNINKGDIVVIEKMEENYNKLKKGEVIAFKYGKVVVVHRIINVVKDENKYYFYTKGDANENEDNYAVQEDMIIGKVNIKIPYIGLPAVWFNEL